MGKKSSSKNPFTLILNFFNKVMGWFVHISNIQISQTTIQEQTVIVVCSEIEKFSEGHLLKKNIQAAAEAVGVEKYLNRMVKEKVEVQDGKG